MLPVAEREPLAPLAFACAAFAGGVLLNIDRVPMWSAPLVALLLMGWRLLSARAALPLPGVLARALLALLLVAVVLMRFHTLNGLTAGTALLMLMGGLKLLETRTRRDEFVMVVAGLFLLLAACLDRQSLARAPLYALQAWLCCAALAGVAAPRLAPRAALRLAARALLVAAPLALLLFVLFPRVPGAFWAIPHGDTARTGLSDTLSPGSIVELVSNYEPAFRVQFTGALPPPEERYWRGPVLHDFDGHTWRRSGWDAQRRPRLEYLGTRYAYRVSLEPTHRRWWFALDLPAQSPALGVSLSFDNQLIGTDPVNEPLSFEAVSFTRSAALEPLSAAARRQDTALPPAQNPRTRELAARLHEHADSDARVLQAALDYLRTGGFVYSVTPELLGADAVDDFLFQTREGFCGHYASAFVTLMRAAGLPARVVTGYLGGEWNPIGHYLLVRQSDAHAWAEVWLEGRGWTRVDPTAVVAPERLQRGLLDLLPDAFAASERLLHASWLSALMQRWDAANAWWTEHVVKFDLTSQLHLLERLGAREPDVRQLAWGFVLALIVWLAFVAWHSAGRSRPPRPDTLARAYLRLCRKLARRAPARAAHQGPMSFAAALAAARPDLEATVRPLLARYAQLRYGPQPSAGDIEAFRRAVARLSLPRALRST